MHLQPTFGHLRENLLFGCFIGDNMLSTGYEMTGYLEVSMGRAPETSVMTSQNGSSRTLTFLFDRQNLDKDRREYFFSVALSTGYEMTRCLQVSMGRGPETSVMTSQNGSSRTS